MSVRDASTSAVRNGEVSTGNDQFSRALLSAMLALKEGDFAVRMPSDLIGVDGKIADAFNEIALLSERRAHETARVTHAVGKEGKLKQRMAVSAVPSVIPRSVPWWSQCWRTCTRAPPTPAKSLTRRSIEK